MYKDFATGESGGLTKFVATLYGCTFSQAALKAKQLAEGQEAEGKQMERKKKEPSTAGIDRHGEGISFIAKNGFSIDEMHYFNQYGISEYEATAYGIQAVFRMHIDGRRIYDSDRGGIAFALPASTGFQIYRPYDEKYRFLNRLDRNAIFNKQGIIQAKNEIIILTKSLKDVICIEKCGFPAFAFISESNRPTVETMQLFCNWLKARRITVLVCYDNDEAGETNAAQICEDYECFHPLEKTWAEKDFSDQVKKEGADKANERFRLSVKTTTKHMIFQ